MNMSKVITKPATKFIAIILTLAFALTLFPVLTLSARAATVTDEIEADDTADDGGTGWEWDSDSLTLTLDGLDMEIDSAFAVKLPDGSTIELIGNNTIVSTSGDGITCEGDLFITGGGSLEIDASIAGFSATGDVYIDDADIVIISGKYGIYSESDVLIEGGNIAAIDGNYGIHGQNVIIEGGIFEIAAGEVGIYGEISVEINGGAGTVEIDDSSTEYATVASAGDIEVDLDITVLGGDDLSEAADFGDTLIGGATVTAFVNEEKTDEVFKKIKFSETYEVTLNQATGGTADASKASALYLDEVTLGVTLEDGYEFVSWDVSPAVTWTTGSGTEEDAAFTMPAGDVTITPAYKHDEPASTDPSDPGDPTDPSDPDDPSDPTDPSDPGDPSDPSDPGDPEGWVQNDDGVWFYFESPGVMKKNDWVLWKGIWYYLKPDGEMAENEWVLWKNIWYYLGENGEMAQYEWVLWKDTWYYLGENGEMAEYNWVLWRDGKWYYLGKDGAMAANEWVLWKGLWYWVGRDGAMMANDWVPWKGAWYYLGRDGAMVAGGIFTINGRRHEFDNNGAWVRQTF